MGIGAAALGGLAFMALLAYGLANVKVPTAGSGAMAVDRPAPDFYLALFDGKQISLSQQRGKVVVINFWASWCVPCREEAPILENTSRQYKDKGVVFIGVDIQDSEGAARSYLREFDITYPNGQDLGGRIAIDYGVSGIPVTFFISKAGIVSTRWVGAIKAEPLISEIERLLASP